MQCLALADLQYIGCHRLPGRHRRLGQGQQIAPGNGQLPFVALDPRPGLREASGRQANICRRGKLSLLAPADLLEQRLMSRQTGLDHLQALAAAKDIGVGNGGLLQQLAPYPQQVDTLDIGVGIGKRNAVIDAPECPQRLACAQCHRRGEILPCGGIPSGF
ncbi:hypothetical protein D3C77_432860 [compost metagenome]